MRNKLIILISIICNCTFGQKYDFVKILPGQGIVYNNDSILLHKTSLIETNKILKLKEINNCDSTIFLMTMWDGIDSETGEWISGAEYTKEIKFKSITFNFAHETNLDSLELVSIEIKEDSNLKIYTDNGLMIGMINPNIKEKFPIQNKDDYIADNELTFNLYTYGISIYLEILPNEDKKITKISTHHKIE